MQAATCHRTATNLSSVDERKVRAIIEARALVLHIVGSPAHQSSANRIWADERVELAEVAHAPLSGLAHGEHQSTSNECSCFYFFVYVYIVRGCPQSWAMRPPGTGVLCTPLSKLVFH